MSAFGSASSSSHGSGSSNGRSAADWGETYRDAKDAFERAYLREQLDRFNWNISRTAEAIKLERSNLHKKIKQLGIDPG